jgi:hypothetical protein
LTSRPSVRSRAAIAAGALTGQHCLQQQAGIVKGRTARRPDILYALRLEPEVPVLAIGVMHMRPGREILRACRRRDAVHGRRRHAGLALFDLELAHVIGRAVSGERPRNVVKRPTSRT